MTSHISKIFNKTLIYPQPGLQPTFLHIVIIYYMAP